ncbi:hypothetical protein [Flavobacterium sp. AJR]|uniref:hypothetical protein n=1 Tax=Flavobacterium sp. AJR TaxID=1979369 RepID=UPI000F4EA6A8|nr:hypothetical protein [Flavobacterium sp. AJR]
MELILLIHFASVIEHPNDSVYASWFENGQAEVTFKAKKYLGIEEHEHVESDEWFNIDRKGNRIE